MDVSYFADEGEVVLAGFPLKVRGAVEYGLVNIHGRKVNQGDPGPDDHPVNSTWIQREWTGGGQVAEGTPDANSGRFWWSTCDTEKKVITLPPYTHTYTIATPPGGATALGDFLGNFYASFGTSLRRYSGDNFNTVVGTLGGSPESEGVAYVPQVNGVSALKGIPQFYIPFKSAGYSRFNGTTISSVATTAIDFEVWGNKLFRLGADGSLTYTIDGESWVNIGTNGITIPNDYTPTKLKSYFNKQGAPALHIATDGGVYVLDFDNSTLYALDLEFPKHPYQGRAFAKWRGDLWISVGTGAHRTDGGLIEPAGLDRDDGLPQDFLGYIIDYAPSYNYLMNLLQGEQIVAVGEEENELLTGAGQNDYYYPPLQDNSLLMAWNGFGYHYRWSEAGQAPRNIVISQVSPYSVWWSSGTQLYRQTLYRTYFNPKSSPGGEFAERGEHETYWHDWGWKGTSKIMKSIEVYASGCSDTESIEVYYKIDRDENPPVLVGTITTDGEHAFHVGVDAETGNLIGVPHERVKLRFILRRKPGYGPEEQPDGRIINIESRHPRIEWHAVVGRKFLRPQRTFRVVVDCGETNKGFPGVVIQDELEKLTFSPRAYPLTHRGRTIMVDVVSLNGPDRPGTEDTSQRAVNMIESFEAI